MIKPEPRAGGQSIRLRVMLGYLRTVAPVAVIGYVFTNVPKPTGLSYCHNSESLNFVVDEK